MIKSTETNTNRKATGNGEAGDSKFLVTKSNVSLSGPKGLEQSGLDLSPIFEALGDNRLRITCSVENADTGTVQRVNMYMQKAIKQATNTAFLTLYGFEGRSKEEIAAEERAKAAEDRAKAAEEQNRTLMSRLDALEAVGKP